MKTVFPRVKPVMRLISTVLALVLISSATTLCQADETKLILDHSDFLDFMGGESDVLNLNGNVHFTHGDIDLYSDRATWYRKSGLVRFDGSVRAIDRDRTIDASTLTYLSRDRRIIAEGDVRIDDKRDDILLNCGKADYFRGPRQFYAYDQPVLILNPYNDSTRIEINSLRMEYFAEDSSGTAYDSVTIIRQDLTATGGTARFKRDPEGIILFNDPVVVKSDNRLSGDTISIFTQNRNIERLVTVGDARALYKIRPDTTVDDFTTAELTGRELEVYFEGDEIDKAVMRRNAVSVYIPAVTDTLTKGTNTASGDSITLYFDNGAISRVFISGGAEGKYIEPKKSEEGEAVFDTTVYNAREIDYNFSDSRISLLHNGELHYQDMNLQAGDISYNLNDKILSARGLVDDSTGEEFELPVLLQGSDKLDGRKMTYNLETEKGQVSYAKTVFENAYYNSENIRQVSNDEMFVSQGNYTSCDEEEDTHYHFHSDKMKMIGKDKVVAKPVILYIGEIPVFAIPYYVFPIRKGRHSGFLTFEIGNFERGERFIRNLGYYWAASDYWDLETSLDFYETQRIILNNRVKYRILYVLNGDVGLNYARETAWIDFKRSVRTRWQLNLTHSQTISPSVSLVASGRFLSDKNYIEDNIYDPEERLNRVISSSASLTKRWKSSSLVVKADQTWNLDTDARQELLPSVSFSRSKLPLFPDPAASRKTKRVKPWEEFEPPRKRFYHNLYFDFSTTGQNKIEKIALTDSTHYWRRFQTIFSKSSLSISQRMLGILTVEPNANVTQTVYHVEWNPIVEDLGLETTRLFTRETYGLGIGAKTDLYGTVYPNIFGITGLRHVMTPSIRYSFTPEIKNNDAYRIYTRAGSASRRSKSLSYSLSNLFQTKYRAGETEKKLDLFTISMSGAYDFAAETRKLSNLSTNITTWAIPNLSITYNSSHSFYNFDNSRRPLSKLRLESVTITSTLKGGYRQGGSGSGDDSNRFPDRGGRRSPFDSGSKNTGQISNAGFDFTLSHRYSLTKGEFSTSKTQWIDLSLNIQPAAAWSMSYTNHYDIKEKIITTQELNISRNMHCWEGLFTWIPSGPVAGYYVRINIKSLPDIKVEKSEGGIRGRY